MNFELSQKNVEFRRSNESLSNDLKSFQEKFVLSQKEKDELKIKCVKLEKIVLKFSKGEENLNKLLSTKKSFNKEGNGLLNRLTTKLRLLFLAIPYDTV